MKGDPFQKIRQIRLMGINILKLPVITVTTGSLATMKLLRWLQYMMIQLKFNGQSQESDREVWRFGSLMCVPM